MSYRILLCDDEVHILNASKFKFQRAGFEVLTASDGEEAWPIIQQQSPDIVVTDYQMPRLSGLQLIARMREHELTRTVPVIMLTAKGFEMPQSDHCQQHQIARILHKPFSPRELLKRVEEVLAQHAARLSDTQPLPDLGAAARDVETNA